MKNRGMALLLALCMTLGLGAYTGVAASAAESWDVLVTSGIFQESDGTQFDAEGPVTTAQLAVYLGRLAKADVNLAAEGDTISLDNWSNGYVAWAKKNGILQDAAQYQELSAEEINAALAAYCELKGIEKTEAAGADGAAVAKALADIYENSWTYMDKKPRVLVTTDLEVDDMNGIILTLMYANEYDIAGLVATAGMFHFEGDGEHTLAEITPNYRCEVGTIGGTIENAGQLKSFRPAEPHFLERIVNVNYRADYEFLSQNDPNYPDPDALLERVKTGNVQFEGDYRFDTDGSEWIKACIMDGDPRPIYIQHWGGINTTVRALVSLYDEYHAEDGTPAKEWDAIVKKVTDKVRLVGSGEDYCRDNSGIDAMYPGLKGSDRTSFFGYGNFFSAVTASEDLLPYYQAEYLTDAFKFHHGFLMSEFHLMGDGLVIYGEPFVYQYGLTTDMFWAELFDLGYSVAEYVKLPMLNHSMDRYDWMCLQFGNASFIDIGLRQGLTHSDNHYTAVMFDELAARADWGILPYEECNHAPVVKAESLNLTAKAGETVSLAGSAEDPDGDELKASWWIPVPSCTYGREEVVNENGSGGPQIVNEKAPLLTLSAAEGWETTLTIPEDAQPGDLIVVNLEVQDQGVERPMTRFAQFVIEIAE
ncbi:MAG: DUF1593 domain-containing protein [Lachnospiraceae bacterium]|nr:DUF1593 domain-containing protein [Lachnospiraceae bacterium]